MRVTVNKTSKGNSYYIIRSVAASGNKSRSSTEVVERLGTEEDIKKKYGCEDALAWAKQRAEELTLQEKEKETKVLVPFTKNMLIPAGEKNSFNIGYLFLQQIYYELGLHNICHAIERRHGFTYDLNDILSRLIYCRILTPTSKLSTCRLAKDLLEQPGFEYHQVARSLSVIAEEFDFIQAQVYKNSEKVIQRKTKVLYYDCTNFYFEIEQEDGFRKYGHSKENRPNPIVQMGMFMDRSGLPLAVTITPGSTNEQITLRPLEEKIMQDFGESSFVVCTDAGLSSEPNKKFNNFGGRYFITAQSIKKLSKEYKDWCLEPTGWKLQGEEQTYDIRTLDDTEEHYQANYEKVFYKEKFIEGYDVERDIEFNQTLFVTYSLKYRDYLRRIRDNQVQRAQNAINQGSSRIERKNQQDFRRFIARTSTTKDGTKADKTAYSIDQEAVSEEEKYDGFYAVCTNMEGEVDDIIRANKARWEIEESFRIMKTEFAARPVYVRREDRIRAHFLTCFLALLIYRILERKIGGEFTCEDIIGKLREMKVVKLPDGAYMPSYERNDVTDSLHETAGFRTDYMYMTDRYMRGVIRTSRCMKATKKSAGK